MVGHFTDDLDNNTTICRGLGVYRVNEDFAIFKPDGSDFVVNFLKKNYSVSDELSFEPQKKGKRKKHKKQSDKVLL